jgi:hypothetical protein
LHSAFFTPHSISPRSAQYGRAREKQIPISNVDGTDVLAHLTLNVPHHHLNQTQCEVVVELAGYLARKLETLRPDEASAARVLRETVKKQRLG